VTATTLRLSPAAADALDGLLDLAESVNGQLDAGQLALSEELDRARRAAPPSPPAAQAPG
jgi:dsDNA-binding SOS-regulon protein